MGAILIICVETGRDRTGPPLGANPVREKIWPRRFPQSIITTLRNITEIETALVDLFWAHLPY